MAQDNTFASWTCLTLFSQEWWSRSWQWLIYAVRPWGSHSNLVTSHIFVVPYSMLLWVFACLKCPGCILYTDENMIPFTFLWKSSTTCLEGMGWQLVESFIVFDWLIIFFCWLRRDGDELLRGKINSTPSERKKNPSMSTMQRLT